MSKTHFLSTTAPVLFGCLGVMGCGGNIVSGPEGGGGSAGAPSTSITGEGGADTASSSASSTTTSGPTTLTGEGGAPSEGCEALSVIALSDPFVMDNGVDAKWSPGESVSLAVTLTNTSDMDAQYPGIVVTTTEPLVTPPSATNTFFVLFANDSQPLPVGFQADPAIPTGTFVPFVARIQDISGVVCDNLPALAFEIPIDSP